MQLSHGKRALRGRRLSNRIVVTPPPNFVSIDEIRGIFLFLSGKIWLFLPISRHFLLHRSQDCVKKQVLSYPLGGEAAREGTAMTEETILAEEASAPPLPEAPPNGEAAEAEQKSKKKGRNARQKNEEDPKALRTSTSSSPSQLRARRQARPMVLISPLRNRLLLKPLGRPTIPFPEPSPPINRCPLTRATRTPSP